jgi:hypothetical protein
MKEAILTHRAFSKDNVDLLRFERCLVSKQRAEKHQYGATEQRAHPFSTKIAFTKLLHASVATVRQALHYLPTLV